MLAGVSAIGARSLAGDCNIYFLSLRLWTRRGALYTMTAAARRGRRSAAATAVSGPQCSLRTAGTFCEMMISTVASDPGRAGGSGCNGLGLGLASGRGGSASARPAACQCRTVESDSDRVRNEAAILRLHDHDMILLVSRLLLLVYLQLRLRLAPASWLSRPA